MIVPEEPNVLHEFGFDVFVEKEFRKNLELPPQKLKGEVDGGVHDADPVGPDGIGHVANIDRIQVFVVRGFLHKNLVVEVVEVFGHEDVNVPHDFQHVEALKLKKR